MRFVVRAKDDCLGIGHPDEASDPVIEPLREVLSLPAFPVVQHQPGAITFVSGTKLGTVRNVPAIRRIEGRGVAGRIVGRDVFGCPSIHRNDPQVVVSRGCFEFVVIRDVAEFLAVGREGVVVLSAETEDGRIVIAGRQVTRNGNLGAQPFPGFGKGGCRNDENVRALAFLVDVPVTIEQTCEDQRLHRRLGCFVELPLIAGLVLALGIYIRCESDVSSIRRPDRSAGFGGNRSQLVNSGHRSGRAVEVRDPDLRTVFFCGHEQEALAIGRPARAIGILFGH